MIIIKMKVKKLVMYEQNLSFIMVTHWSEIIEEKDVHLVDTHR